MSRRGNDDADANRDLPIADVPPLAVLVWAKPRRYARRGFDVCATA